MGAVHRYLLTGAGFTKNFGGFLGDELWARVFNHSRVQALTALRAKLLADPDVESAYHNVMAGKDNLEKQAIVDAVFAAHRQMDDTLREFTFMPGSPYPVNIYRVQKLIAAFSGARDNPGHIFTLNQDLFLERHYYNGPRPVLPGIRQATEWFSTHFHSPLDAASAVQIVESDDLEKVKAEYRKHHELAYVKLHGSCNWGRVAEPTHMVIGRDKLSQIGRNYLLSWYLELFVLCLAAPGSRLLVVGYGFADPHINQVLAESILKHDLTVYILDPTPSREFIQRIRSQPAGETILHGIGGFYPVALKDLFPANQEETSEWRAIQTDFFGRRVM